MMDIDRKLATNDLDIPAEGDPRRSPSPEPVYDKNGVRLNTRDIRWAGPCWRLGRVGMGGCAFSVAARSGTVTKGCVTQAADEPPPPHVSNLHHLHHPQSAQQAE